jgi:hypothetical protein
MRSLLLMLVVPLVVSCGAKSERDPSNTVPRPDVNSSAGTAGASGLDSADVNPASSGASGVSVPTGTVEDRDAASATPSDVAVGGDPVIVDVRDGGFEVPAGCDLVSSGSSGSPADRCSAGYDCEGRISLRVECDGENDGTFTSLCTCMYERTRWDIPNVVQGEGPESCNNATMQCLEHFATD